MKPATNIRYTPHLKPSVNFEEVLGIFAALGVPRRHAEGVRPQGESRAGVLPRRAFFARQLTESER